eukprot:TRINITY_DN1155_c0_g2_i1.p2 TRINITY_DN1155_c0_g2~~TRINITY_DN1155_c0_g2_i1.p2  ORF type:complete len:124 (-),score=53.90 TRINITY_DN1155_c0_g2_i1:80-451(-)
MRRFRVEAMFFFFFSPHNFKFFYNKKTNTSTPSAPAAATGADPAKGEVTSIQIRLHDGTRLVARFNLSQTVGDLRAFINASRPECAAMAYDLQLTFPRRLLTDDAATVEAAGLKGAVIVQAKK